jgi:hypothetical protein
MAGKGVVDMRHIARRLLIGSAAALAVALAAIAALAQQQPVPVPVDGNVAQWQAFDANTVLVLSSEDNNLWLEYAPFGTMSPGLCFVPNTNVPQFGCRILIDANVESFEYLDAVFVQSSLDGKLWLEIGPYGGIDLQNWPTCPPGSPNPTSCRIQIDGNVAFFDVAFDSLDKGIQVYVISSQDHNLWLEYGPFGGFDPQNWPTCPLGYPNPASCRILVDGNAYGVSALTINPNIVYVLGGDGKLWLEYGPFGGIDLQNWPTCPPGSPNPTSCRIQIDGNVGYKVRHPPLRGADYAFVQSSLDNNLWLEYAPFGAMPSVPCFDPNTNVQQFGCRIQIDANVQSFWPLNLNTVFVVGTDGNLWLEFGPFGTVPIPLPYCVYPNSQQCRYWIASGAWELSVVDQHSIFVNGYGNGSTWGGGMLSFYNLVGIVP